MTEAGAHRTIRRVVVSGHGGPERLTLVRDVLPEPGPGEVRVRTLAVGVGFPDVLMREGTYPGGPKPPFTPGYDLVGVVEALGPGVTGVEPGERVAAITVFGSYADAVSVPRQHLVRMPDGVDPAEAVCLALNYVTAYQALHRVARAGPGERVLVHGGAGGVGSAALEIAATMGLSAYATATGSGCDVVLGLGATPVDFRREDFVRRIRELTGDGIDVVLDGVGGVVAARSVRVLRPGGRLVMYGHYSTLAGGRRNLRRLTLFYAAGALAFAGNLLPGRRVRTYRSARTRDRHPDWYRRDLGELFRWLAAGRLRPLVAARLPLDGARQAHERLAAGGTHGKLVLVP
ncbi:NADPH2:quinone reductase [Micromonospora citrea]|uniref:NADPH2:quinone reductase n=1 Tax=Micromonospora citrea TaxID=47855 RepID=A0A1C6V4S1_9ACTN|nr:zinc-binding dehydrogenase [Micromonospora citrea]SCL61157.1 NADPH2:quinone reductase [Micromonospora citrea]